MKRLVLTLALAMTFSAFAQDKPEDFRIVNGQIYNIHESGKWEDLAYGHNFDDYYAVLVVRKIGKHGTLDCDREFYDRKRGGGISLSSTTELILKNYPHAEDANIGMKISKCRAMRLRNNPWDTVNTYDYGLPNTPENRNHTRTAWVYGIVMMLVLMGFAGWWICRTKTKS